MTPTFKFALLILVVLGIAWINSGKLPQASQTSNAFQVAFLDVGQGDAILLTTPHQHHVLIDGGPDSTILTRLGEQMPFSEHSFDLVIVTHNHSDHIAGLNRVMERYDVQKMWISGAIHTTNEYLKMLQEIKDKGIPTEVVWKDKTFDIDGLHLEVLHPLTNQTGTRPDDQHDATIVTKATYGTKSFLLTGDIDEGHEQAILDSGANLASDVLKVPHHGSATGLLPAFLDAIHPSNAVIEVGKDNKFGHPTASALKKLSDRAIPTYRTDSNGTVVFTTDGQSLAVKMEH